MKQAKSKQSATPKAVAPQATAAPVVPAASVATQAVPATPAQQREQTLHMAMRQGQWTAVEFAARQFVAEFPQDGKCWHLLGVALLQLQRTLDAEPVLRKAVAHLPKDEEAWDHLGVSLNRQHKLLEAEQAFALSIDLNAERADTWINASKNANDIENYAIGETRAREGLRLAGGKNVSALNNLACALNGLQRYEEAEKFLRQAMSLRPDDGMVHITLAATLSERALQSSSDEKQLEAVRQFESGLALCPGSVEGLSGHATALLRLGDMEASRRSFSVLLNALQKSRNIHYAKATEKPFMPTNKAAEALLALKKSLDAVKVPFFLAYGTLLGIYRGGDILPHDKDLDVGIYASQVQSKPLWDYLEKENLFAIHPLRPGDDANAMWNMELCHRATGISVDLFFFKPDQNTLLSGFAQRPVPVMFRFPNFRTTTLAWNGEVWNVPDSPDMFLETMYGPEWRIPDPGFDGVLSARCLVPASVPVSYCYGLARLYTAIKDLNYTKALSYCRQLLALQEDAAVREWHDWLLTTDQCRAVAQTNGGAA